MTINRLRWLALLAPVAIIAVLEAVRSSLFAPISMRDRVLLDTLIALAFVAFGSIMVAAISRMHERVRRQNRELLALHSAGIDVTSELSLELVLKKVVDRACDLVGAKYGALSVVGEDGTIKAFITSGISDDVRASIGPPPVGHGVLGVVLHEGQRLRLEDVTKHPQSIGFPKHHPPMRTLLAVPIICKTPFVGNLYLADKHGGEPFTEDDEETLVRFAVHTAIAIDNAHLHQQVANLAITQERLRIAHEVHDGIAQVLGYVNTKVQAANEYLRQGKADDASVQLRELAVAARDAYGDVRESIVGLRTLPDENRSAGESIESYVEKWQTQSGISTRVLLDGDLHLPPSVELQLIRIVQEALTNVRKHAKANQVKIEIRRTTGRVAGTITDDGIGFNPAARPRSEFPRFGLTTMRERAESVGGALTIDTTPGHGTTVAFDLPVI